MNNEKLDSQLNLALSVPEDVRNRTTDLETGYNPETKVWELIVKYSGTLPEMGEEISIVELFAGYAIVTIPENQIDSFAQLEQIEFIEKPKNLFFAVNEGKVVSCITNVQTENIMLTGRDVLVAVIDSGIDYSHPDFRNEDGSSRILALWDQTIEEGEPPEGYSIGTLYTKEQLDEALNEPDRTLRLQIVPSIDSSGHGTHVAGICCGNGRASDGYYRGVAYESEMLVVKLGASLNSSFPKTTQIMQAVNYVLEVAISRRQPLAINISFGNSYGSHAGNSLLENYLNDVSSIWKNNICIGSGNEGSVGRHAHGIAGETSITDNGDTVVELAVAEYESSLNVQIWKNYYDDIDIVVISPSGGQSGILRKIPGTQRYTLGNTELVLYYGEPNPYNMLQEIYIEFIPERNYVDSGIWQFRFIPQNIVQGNYDLWLPAGGVINPYTRFLRPSEQTTLTIPATADRVITVGAYDASTDAVAYFTGRGYTRDNRYIKPDLVAPGVDINSCAIGGGYTMRSGTSMATPFVTGAVALMMEWGITRNNDPYLYGEKVKAYLIKGTRKLPGEEVPSQRTGWGALCLENSLPL